MPPLPALLSPGSLYGSRGPCGLDALIVFPWHGHFPFWLLPFFSGIIASMSKPKKNRKKPETDEWMSLSEAIDHVQKSLGCDRETAWNALRERLIAGKITAYGIPVPARSPWASGPDTAEVRKKDSRGAGYQDVQIRKEALEEEP